MGTPKPTSLAEQVFYVLGSALMVLALLYFCKPVLVPLALSVLLAFILNPLVAFLERWKLGRLPSVLIATVLAFGMIGLISWGLAGQLKLLADDLPNHRHEIKSKVAALKTSDDSTLGRLRDMVKDVFPSQLPVENSAEDGPIAAINNSPDVSPEVRTVVVASESGSQFSKAVRTLLPAVEPLATAALVIVLVLFLLLRREDVRYRVISLMGDSALTGTTRLMRDTAERVSNYLLNLLLVNAAFGLWFGIGLYFLGVPYAPLWGFLTLFFRFIPFLGSPASVLFPILISIATSAGWSQPLWILVFFSVSELVTANVIEPILFGKTTGLTPIALLFAALFWAWIWGPTGLLLSTPLTVCLVVLGQRIPALRSLKVLLAEQPVLEARLQYFQRLLAQDKQEARHVFEAYVEEFDTVQAFDDVIVPALDWTRRERLKDVIRAEEENFIWDMNTELLADIRRNRLAECEPPNDGVGDPKKLLTSTLPSVPRIYGYPVHHKSEEIALTMLRELLHSDAEFTLCTTKKLPTKAVTEIETSGIAAVVLAAMPPGGLPQVKFMCEKIRAVRPLTPIIVMHFGPLIDYDELLVELREVGASYLTTTLQQTRHQLLTILSDNDKTVRSDTSLTDASKQSAISSELQSGDDAPEEATYVE